MKSPLFHFYPARKIASAACLFFICVATPALSSSDSPAVVEPPGYNLAWSEDFSREPDGLPDPKIWGYEVGFIRNHEEQYYTKDRLENARIEKGNLIIEGRKEEYTPPGGTKPIAHYTSAAIETSSKVDWKYGRIEVRAKLPTGIGTWPAIWTMGSDIKQVHWPRCGEVDIMELVGKETVGPLGHENGIVHGSTHFLGGGDPPFKHIPGHAFLEDNGRVATQTAATHVDQPETRFHVYAEEWTPDHIDIYVDDKKFFSFDVSDADRQTPNPFRQPHFLLLNLALGGTWGGPLAKCTFPQRMTISWIRVYQKKAATTQ